MWAPVEAQNHTETSVKWFLVCMQMMRVDVTKYNKRYGIVKLAAKAYVGQDVVCEAELTLAMGS